MNSYIAAQHELAATLRNVHESLAVTAMQGIGADITAWSEVPGRHQEMLGLIHAHKRQLTDKDSPLIEEEWDAIDDWGIATVLHDPIDKKPSYSVPLLGADSIRLTLSSSPSEAVTPFSDDKVYTDILFPSFPIKYVHVTLDGTSSKKEDGVVLLGPDMPAIAMHGNNIRYVRDHDPELSPYHENCSPILSAVEAAFGPEAVAPLSEEACLALSGAIKASRSELLGSNQWQHMVPAIF